jgi:hypothetical protein
MAAQSAQTLRGPVRILCGKHRLLDVQRCRSRDGHARIDQPQDASVTLLQNRLLKEFRNDRHGTN